MYARYGVTTVFSLGGDAEARLGEGRAPAQGREDIRKSRGTAAVWLAGEPVPGR